MLKRKDTINMCIKENYNTVLNSNNYSTIDSFITGNCKVDTADHCCKLCGGCDYLGMLEDKIKYLTK